MSATSRPAWRRRAIASAVALVAVLLVLAPGYLAAQPDFFERFAGLSEQYAPWAESAHAEVSCEECHVRPSPGALAAYRVRMTGEFYVALVNRSRVPDVFGAPTNDACMRCHNDLRTISPTGDLQIPHRAHVSVLEMECVECHSYLVHELNPGGEHTPTMEGCLECHDGDRAKDACWACHTQKAAPQSHAEADWLIVHADQANDDACAECHQWAEDWCVQCHSERPQSHTQDWRAVHGDRVAEHRSCEACHANEFCIRCHGDVPQLNYDPTLELVE